jgi:hypothetical protein
MAGPARSSRALARPDRRRQCSPDPRRARGAHLDNDPANNRLANLRGLCQRCHLLHDRPFHLAQRWLTYRRRWAIGDLFFGRYGIQPPSPALFATSYRPRVSQGKTDLRDLGRTTSVRAEISLPQLFSIGT